VAPSFLLFVQRLVISGRRVCERTTHSRHHIFSCSKT